MDANMSHPLNLLDLPVDLLELILRPLLTAPGGGVISMCLCQPSPINPLPIFLIHPSLYAITCPIFYGVANSFVLDLTTGHGKKHMLRYLEDAAEEREELERGSGRQQNPMAQTGGKFLLLSREARRRVRRLEMRFDRLRGWVWDEFGLFLEDMALQGELADLYLTMRQANRAVYRPAMRSIETGIVGGRDDGRLPESSRAIFEKPPLMGLLGLLADPGLRTARLRISQGHDAAWCAFHEEGECGELLSLRSLSRVTTESRSGDQAATSEWGQALVEIDWRAILKAIDPEGRGRAVAWNKDG